MDPAPSRLAAIHNLDQLFEEAGVHTPLKESVLNALGNPATVREVAYVSEEDWQVLATTLTLGPEPGTEGPASRLTPSRKAASASYNGWPA